MVTQPTGTHTTLDGWRALAAVVDEGGYARAAEALGKSQSALSHQVTRLQEQLGVALLRLQGRRAVLTPTGAELLRRARSLLEQAERLEGAAAAYASGAEAELHLAMDTLLPLSHYLPALRGLAEVCPGTRLELQRTVLSGAGELLLARRVDLAVTAQVPPGFVPEPLCSVRFQAVAAPTHPLFTLAREQGELTLADLRPHRQLVVRDSGMHRRLDAGWLGADSRWTLPGPEDSVALAAAGLGFAWLPDSHTAAALAAGQLAPLPLGAHSQRQVQLMLVQAHPEQSGPAQQHIMAALRKLLGSPQGAVQRR